MFTILLASQDEKKLVDFKKYLLDDLSVSVVCETNLFNTLSLYKNINPDILLINSNLINSESEKILNEFSADFEKKENSNIIVSLNNNHDIINLKKYYSKIYKVFYHPVQYSNLKKIIKDFALKNNLVVKDIEYIYLFNLFAKMNFNVYSKGTKYLIYAISECYRNLDLLDGKLSVIYKLIENHFNTNSVSSSIRSALYHFNNNKDHIAIKELSSRFNERANISPKYFLEVVTTYVYYEKNKE